MSSDAEIEKAIQAAGADKAPRITPDHIESLIAMESYGCPGAAGWQHGAQADTKSFLALQCLTICVLTLKNGFTVVGTSACASPENYNEAIGRRIAREEAVSKIWALEGYVLRNKLSGQ